MEATSEIACSRYPLFRTALALVALAVVTAPFSIWLGQTFHFLTLQLPVIAAAIIMCCKISYTWEVLRGIMRILVVAAVALALVAILAFHGGRADASVSYDPNDLAYVLVSTLPLALAFALTARTKAKILTNAAVCTVLLLALLLTSSRGGFFGLLAMLAVLVLLPLRRPPSGGYWLPQIRQRNRIVLPVVGLVCASTLVWPYLPAQTRDRLSTVLQLSSDYNMDPRIGIAVLPSGSVASPPPCGGPSAMAWIPSNGGCAHGRKIPSASQ